MRIRVSHFILFFLCFSWTAAASEGSVTVTAAWSRATAPGASTAVVYLRLENQSNLTVTVEGVETSMDAKARIHKTVSKEGVMKMTPVKELSLAPGEQVEFKPGGLHVMLMGLTRLLDEGETFTIRVTFLKHPDVRADVLVGTAGQMKAP